MVGPQHTLQPASGWLTNGSVPCASNHLAKQLKMTSELARVVPAHGLLHNIRTTFMLPEQALPYHPDLRGLVRAQLLLQLSGVHLGARALRRRAFPLGCRLCAPPLRVRICALQNAIDFVVTVRSGYLTVRPGPSPRGRREGAAAPHPVQLRRNMSRGVFGKRSCQHPTSAAVSAQVVQDVFLKPQGMSRASCYMATALQDLLLFGSILHCSGPPQN